MRIASGTPFDYYYNEQWQLLEDRKGGDPVPHNQYVWHPHYIDALAVRYQLTGEETYVAYYHLYDANFNVTAVLDASSAVLERFHYSPYGEVTFLKKAEKGTF